MDDGTPIISQERTADGRDGPRWSLTTKMPLRDAATGEVLGLVGLNRDVTRLRLAEQARLASERQSKVILAAMSDAVHVVDEDCVLLFVNEAMSQWARRAGLSGEIVGRCLREVAPFLPARVFDEYRRIFSEGRCLTTEDTFHLEGRDLATETRRIPVFSGDRVAQVITIIRDVTELKRTQEALDRSESLLRQMLENLPLILFSAEAGTNRTLLMRGAVKSLFGYDAEDFLRDAAFGRRLEHRDDADRVHEAFAKGLASMRPFSLKYRAIHGTSGESRWMQQFVVPVADENGNLLRHDSVVIDITEREEAELQSARLARAVSNAGEGIAIWTENWTLTYANEAMARIFGAASATELASQDWASLFLSRDSSQERRQHRPFGRRAVWQRRVSAARFDGSRIFLAVTLSRLPLETGGFLIVGNVRDMTREESYLGQLRRFSRDADRLLEEERDRISKELHDELGQLLTAINIGLAGLRTRLESGQFGELDRVDELGELVQRLLSSVRNLARSLRPGTPDYRSIQDSLGSLISDLSRSRNISYQVEAHPADLDVPKQLRRVLYRIAQEALTNVLRHSNATQCRITLRRTSEKLIFRIRDNGRLADPQALEGQASLGIIGMKERASAVGGTLQVTRMADGGVCVKAQFPSSSWIEGEHDKDTDRR
jgi:PAS domain S-box-containing protein